MFEDEASFRQDATLHATWSRRGTTPIVPVSSSRNSIKVFGCVEIHRAKFLYNFADRNFNADSYIDFLEKIVARHYFPRKVFYIQDNAPYHKNKLVWAWFAENKKWLFVKNLPPYCPELNATESIWRYTRMQGIHNQYFDTQEKIRATLSKVFYRIKRNPREIEAYMRPFL